MQQAQGNRFACVFLFCLILILGGQTAFAQTGPGILAFSPAIVAVSEGAGSVTLTVTRSQGSIGAVSVSYATVNGTALAPGDYSTKSGMLSWADGDSVAKFFMVPIAQNATVESSREFKVFLSNATGGAEISVQNGQPGLSRVTIIDDEPDPFPGPGTLADFTSTNYGGGGPWTIDTQFGFQSATSLRSSTAYAYDGFTYDDETGELFPTVYPGVSLLQLQGDFLAGNLTFAYRVSSGPNGRFNFSSYPFGGISATGQTDWQTFTIQVTAGDRLFSWQFVNDSRTPCVSPATSDGLPCTDRAYIDSIMLPPRAARLTVLSATPARGTVDVSGQNTCSLYSSCAYYLSPGAMVTLSANVASGYFFSGWSGACAGNVACTLTMDVAKSVTATFLPVSPTISIAVYGDDQGIVTSNPPGISCPPDCSAAFPNGTTITLTATPVLGSAFNGWFYIENCSGAGPCTFNLTDNKNIFGTFFDVAPSLTVTLAGTGIGTVISSPPGISCPGTCTAEFPRNSNVTLTSTSNAGSYSSNFCYGYTICNFSMSTNQSITATFLPGSVSSAPLLLAVNPGVARLSLVFDAPTDSGGLSINNYTASCGSVIAQGTSSPLVVSGLTVGMPYLCSIKAVNAAGTSAASNSMSGTPVPALALINVISRKVHGSAGEFDRFINDTILFSGPVSIEPRMIGAGHKLIFTFNVPLISVGFVSSSSGTTNYERDNNKLIVTLSDVPDNRRVLIQLTDVASIGGLLSKQVSVGFMVGDVTRSGKVTAADFSAIKAGRSPTLNLSNFLFDIDLSGAIDSADVSAAKARAGSVLP